MINPNSPVGSRDSTKNSGLPLRGRGLFGPSQTCLTGTGRPSQKSLSVIPATARTFLFVKTPAFIYTGVNKFKQKQGAIP